MASDDSSLPAIPQYDAAMTAYLERTGAPAGALAVIRDGGLVHFGAYGTADTSGAAPSVATRFRVASLSKMWTASAIRTLVAQGRLGYDTRAYDVLDVRPPVLGDPRIATITIAQLLDHRGGWDSSASGDPMFDSRGIASALGVASPPSMWQTAYFMFQRPLDFAPGSRSAYSNFGYGLLGLVVSAITGLPYEESVVELVLRPAGVWTMTLGLTREPLANEPRYEMPSGSSQAWSVFDPPSWVDWPYGGFAIEPMAAHGGWIASALDLARYARALDERRADAVMRPETSPIPTDPVHRYQYVNVGSLPGAFAILRRDWDGTSLTAACAAFNFRTGDSTLDSSIKDDLANALASVAAWPIGTDF